MEPTRPLNLPPMRTRTETEMGTEVEVRNETQSALRMLIESLPVGIILSEESGRITDLNQSAVRMFGYTRQELVGNGIEILLPDRFRHSHQRQRDTYARKPYVRPMGIGMELVGRRKDGTEFPVEVSLGPLVTKEGTLVSSTIVDITERKKIEQQLRLAQRMEAIGQLAGGIAHDFNNLLAVIIGSADILADEVTAAGAIAKKVDLIRNAGSSAADLVRQLLAFSRQQMIQPVVLDTNKIVETTQAMLRRLIGENIQLSVAVEQGVGFITADPGQIEQVLLNLAVNARDAMPQGGRLSIQASNVDLDDADKKKHDPIVPGRYVLLAVEDTGCGMDLKTQARIFDPFFTTKEVGKGTGLGLATVYSIVKQSRGYVWVYSEVGQGTIFKIYLPRADRAVHPERHTEEALTGLQGSETILLAEDSESLREMAREYLESIGYTVLDASSGTQALERAKKFAGRIDLLLTDIVMPEMGGPELADQILSLRPDVKVIFTSGYTGDLIAGRAPLDPARFIQKPYRPKALARKIRELLRGAG